MRKRIAIEPKSTTHRYAAAARTLAQRDPVLRRVIFQVGPCTLRPEPDVLTVLIRTIISQQLATKAALTIADRLFAHTSVPCSVEAIERLDDAQLRACGLSGAKRRALRDLCRHIRHGTIPLEPPEALTDDQWREALLQVRGIGPWSVDMFLIFCLGRLDVFPVGDLGLRLGVQTAYDLPEVPSAAALESFGERWRPYRTVATWYLWRSRGPVPQS